MRSLAVLVALLPLVACKRREAAPQLPPDAASPAAVDRRIPEAEVRKLLDEWLAAQNEGSFARYEALYADRFQGVRRSGPRTVRLDRRGWVEDRKRMFGKPMKVEIAELELARTSTDARARFRQTWASANYKDVGAKQLLLVKTPAGLRIAREEMLDSTIVGGTSRGQRSLDMFLLADQGEVWLHTRPEDAWGGGPVSGGEDGARREVAEEALPEDLRAWKGRKLRLFGPAGPLCEATLSGFALHARVTPHFGTLQSWRGESGEPRWSAPRIAADMWEMAGGDGRWLAGELAQTCPGAVWASGADKPVPRVAAAEKASGPLLAAALAAFRALPAHREIQRLWAKEDPHAEGVWDAELGAPATVWALRHPSETLVVITAGETVGCGEFTGDLTAFFRVTGPEAAPRLVPLGDHALGELALPVSAFDLDGDGHLEILFGPEGLREQRGLYRWDGAKYQRVVLVGTPFNDCPC
jgi:hypothetical protein